MKKWQATVLWVALWGCADQDADGDPDRKDCADFDPEINRDAKEVCDGVDNNCNGQIDEGVSIVAYWDRDRDGFGDPDKARRVCKLPEDGSETAGDCDDLDPLVNPDAEEICDGVDNNCEGSIDEDAPLNTFYADTDGDGRGDPSVTTESCLAPSGYIGNDDDCDDANPAAWTDREEICDSEDNNCDGAVDEGLALIRQWVDADGDGAGDPDTVLYACGPGDGVADNGLDCDDTDPSIGINAEDLPGDQIDQDCDGFVDEYGVPVPYATLSDALAAAPDGAVVQFDAGIHTGTFDLTGRDITLAGEGCERTELYGDSQGNVVRMDAGRITALTLRGGYAQRGGGMLVTGDVQADEICAVENVANNYGGGIAVLSGSLEIEDSVLSGNASGERGGGIHVFEGASLTVRRSHFTGNDSEDGGGLSNNGGPVSVSNTVFAGNSANDGGAVHNEYTDELDPFGVPYEPVMTLSYVTLHANQATSYSQALSNHGAELSIDNSIFTGHEGGNPTAYAWATFNPLHDEITTLDYVAFRDNGYWDLTDRWLPGMERGAPVYVEVDPTRPVTEWDLHLQLDSEYVDAGDPSASDPDGSPADLGAYGGPGACVARADAFTTDRWGSCPGPSWDYAWRDDDDGDGIWSAYEIANGLDPWADDAADDLDGDGLTNLEEFTAGSAADQTDSDGDGVDDASEVAALTDPADPSDQRPFADGGPDLWGAVGSALAADGSFSWDPNDDALSWSWTLTEVPVGSLATVDDPAAPTATFTPDVDGTYVLELTVSDGGGAHADTVVARAVDGAIVPDDHPTIQAAIDAAGANDGVLIRPGTYEERIDTSGKNLTLLGLGAAEEVVLDGDYLGTVVTIDQGEDVTLARLTLRSGLAAEGGGIRAMDAGTLELHDLVLTDNEAHTLGGGLFLGNTEVIASKISLLHNRAADGAGIYVSGAPLELVGSRLIGNIASDFGGAFFVDIEVGPGTIHHLENNVFQDNSATHGAAVAQQGKPNQVFLLHNAIVGSTGDSVLYSGDARTFEMNNVFLNNAVTWLHEGILDRTHQLPFNNVSYGDTGDLWYDPADAGAVEPFLTGDPKVLYTDDGNPDNDVFAAVPGSSMHDAGFPDWTDADGTISDIGPSGGAGAERRWARWAVDADADGMSDGWEAHFGLDPTRDDSAEDLDGDGVLNLDEYAGGTDPSLADTDGDGVADGVDANPVDPGDNAPAALAGGPYQGMVATVVQLDGSGSSDPNGDPLGYTWRLVDTPPGSALSDSDLVAADTATPHFTPDVHGIYTLGLVVDDGVADSVEDRARVYGNIDLHVPGTYPTVWDAFADVIPGDVILLAAGSWDLYLDDFPSAVTLAGSGVDQTFLQGVGGLPIIEIAGGQTLGLRDLTLTAANGDDGGALECTDSQVTLERVRFEFNTSREGAAALLDTCVSTFVDVEAFDNDSKGSGGAFLFRGGEVSWTRGELARNQAGQYGGGVYLDSTIGSITNVLLHHNEAASIGGAIYQRCPGLGAPCPEMDLDHLTIAGNWGYTASTYFQSGSIRHTIFQENQGRGLYTKAEVSGEYNAYFANQTSGVWPTNWEDPTDLEVDAAFVRFSVASDGYGDDFHLLAGSPLIDAGAAPLDLDGSLEDIGAYGGAGAAADYDYWYIDADGDGLPDGWEASMGLVDGVDGDPGDDPDADGLDNLSEYAQGTDAHNSDTDGDGISDGDEVLALTDPADPSDNRPTADAGPDEDGTIGVLTDLTGVAVDPNLDPCTYSWQLHSIPGRSALTDGDLSGDDQATVSFTPDTPGTFELSLTVDDGSAASEPDRVRVLVEGAVLVPEDYPDIATAIDRTAEASSVRISAGTWPLRVTLEGADVSLIGAGEDLTVLDGEHRDQVIEASQGEAVHLEALTVQHGIGALGGAMTVIDGSLTLDHVTFRANDGVYGGALYLEDANLVATGTSWVDNTASHYGGAAYVEYSTVDVQQSRFAGNFVGNTHGGALYSYATDLSLSNSVIADNDAIQGGALYLTGSDQDYDNDGLPDRTSATLDFLTGVHNAGVSLGAFMRKGYADVVLSNSIVAHNRDNVAISLSDGTGYTQYTTLTADNDVRDFGNFDPGTEPQTGDLNGNIVDGLTDFVSRTDDGDWTNDDLHLLDTSEARDAGDPLLQDPDGSPADMGAYGGPNGDW